MHDILIAIDYQDPAWLLIAFALGFIARLVSLPPLIGFLVAGFLLNGLGASGGAFLSAVADLGVTLLLFTIGLKLNVGSLLRPDIWAVATLHMLFSTLLAMAVVWGIVVLLGFTGGMDLRTAAVIGFALSFSSTVFAVKMLEEQGELSSRYGKRAVGILIIQDIAAVTFLAASTGKIPSVWAMGLLLLIPARHLLVRLLMAVGHGELLILYGITLALGGAALFELVGLKGDLGALVVGVLLSGSLKTKELSEALMGFKELFLVGFFLSIGMMGLPQWSHIGVAVLLLPLLAVKSGMFILLFTRFKVRARSSVLAGLTLTNFSEFGLIAGAVAVSAGWLTPEWLVTIAIALSLSFIVAAPLNERAEDIYDHFHDWLNRFEANRSLTDEECVVSPGIKVAVFGLGRVGTGAYDQLAIEHPDGLIGIDADEEIVARMQVAGKNVILGDAMDHEFWRRLVAQHVDLELTLFTMPNHKENLAGVRLLKAGGFSGRIGVIARFPDEVTELQQEGVDFAFNLYQEAGSGLATHALRAE